MEKNALLTLVLLATFGGSLLWLSITNRRPLYPQTVGLVNSEEANETEVGNSPPPVREETVESLLALFKNDSRIAFSEAENKSFTWNLKQGEEIIPTLIAGWEITVEGVPNQMINTDPFFISRNFQLDINNVAAGQISGLTGYRREDIVCLVSGEAGGGEEAFLEGDGRMNLSVSCGNLNDRLIESEPPRENEDQMVKGEFYEINAEEEGRLNVSASGEGSVKASSVVVSDGSGTTKCGVVEIGGERVIFEDESGSFDCQDAEGL